MTPELPEFEKRRLSENYRVRSAFCPADPDSPDSSDSFSVSGVRFVAAHHPRTRGPLASVSSISASHSGRQCVFWS